MTTRLPEALALLREKGWCKGTAQNFRGEHCIIGAINHLGISGSILLLLHDVAAVERVITEQYGGAYQDVPDFNDDPVTTFADVERVMEKAILERGGSL